MEEENHIQTFSGGFLSCPLDPVILPLGDLLLLLPLPLLLPENPTTILLPLVILLLLLLLLLLLPTTIPTMEEEEEEEEEECSASAIKPAPPEAERIRKVSDFLCVPKFNTQLPDFPFEPKNLRFPFGENRFIKYRSTSLEKSWKRPIHTTSTLGINLEMIDPDVYAVPASRHLQQRLDDVDEEIVKDTGKLGERKGEDGGGGREREEGVGREREEGGGVGGGGGEDKRGRKIRGGER